MGETANGRTGETRISPAGAMSLRRLLRPGERIGLMRCRRLAHSPFRRPAPGSWASGSRKQLQVNRIRHGSIAGMQYSIPGDAGIHYAESHSLFVQSFG